MSLQWKVCNTRNNYVDRIWSDIKQQITKELRRDYSLCISYNLWIIIFHYIDANIFLITKHIIHHIKFVTKTHIFFQNYNYGL